MEHLYSHRWTCTLAVGEPVAQPATAVWMTDFGLLPTRKHQVTTKVAPLRDVLSIV
jgi:hypothetical protein